MHLTTILWTIITVSSLLILAIETAMRYINNKREKNDNIAN